jgi:tRNA A37 threonylcarbamoyladenosine dehydratase
LARRVRKSLRERGITSGISAVWSIEEASPAVKEQGPERSPIGSISYMPAIMGLTAASILIRKISYS